LFEYFDAFAYNTMHTACYLVVTYTNNSGNTECFKNKGKKQTNKQQQEINEKTKKLKFQISKQKTKPKSNKVAGQYETRRNSSFSEIKRAAVK